MRVGGSAVRQLGRWLALCGRGWRNGRPPNRCSELGDGGTAAITVILGLVPRILVRDAKDIFTLVLGFRSTSLRYARNDTCE